jgi:hypothetical protein
VIGALDRLATRVDDIYLHVDFDAFAPDVAPGVADEPVPGGLSFDDAEAIVRATAERFQIKAATLATYTPALDEGDRTLGLGLRLIRLIADSFGRSPSGPAVSKHLRVLERAGLIVRGREAQWRPCRLEPAPLKEVAEWAEPYRRFWDASYERLDEYLRHLREGEANHGRR